MKKLLRDNKNKLNTGFVGTPLLSCYLRCTGTARSHASHRLLWERGKTHPDPWPSRMCHVCEAHCIWPGSAKNHGRRWNFPGRSCCIRILISVLSVRTTRKVRDSVYCCVRTLLLRMVVNSGLLRRRERVLHSASQFHCWKDKFSTRLHGFTQIKKIIRHGLHGYANRAFLLSSW